MLLRERDRDRFVRAIHRTRWWGHQAFWAADMRSYGSCPDCSRKLEPVIEEFERMLEDATNE